MRIALLLLALVVGQAWSREVRTWQAVGGFETRASFVGYAVGVVKLEKENGQIISVPLHRLIPRHRVEILKLAEGNGEAGKMPMGPVQPPSGRREIVFNKLEEGDHWPSGIAPAEKQALLAVDSDWKHAESRYFVLHYQNLGYARRVARMADFFYQYIASDLPEYQDRVPEKSHIVVVKNREDWRQYLAHARTMPQWAGAYVRGNIMFLPDTDDRKRNADVVAHEMSHLVLNRFFVYPPPLWLNEGLAEWYEGSGWKSFKGQLVDEEEGLGDFQAPYRVEELMSLTSYPQDANAVPRFYASCRQVVGMLRLMKGQKAFVTFLQGVTVEGRPVEVPLNDVYGLADADAVQKALNEFLK